MDNKLSPENESKKSRQRVSRWQRLLKEIRSHIERQFPSRRRLLTEQGADSPYEGILPCRTGHRLIIYRRRLRTHRNSLKAPPREIGGRNSGPSVSAVIALQKRGHGDKEDEEVF